MRLRPPTAPIPLPSGDLTEWRASRFLFDKRLSSCNHGGMPYLLRRRSPMRSLPAGLPVVHPARVAKVLALYPHLGPLVRRIWSALPAELPPGAVRLRGSGPAGGGPGAGIRLELRLAPQDGAAWSAMALWCLQSWPAFEAAGGGRLAFEMRVKASPCLRGNQQARN